MPTRKTAAPSATRKAAGRAPARTKTSVSPKPVQASPANGLADLARERPGLVLGGAVLAGLVVGALIPRGAAGKLARGAAGAAALGSEVGFSLARQTRDNAHRAAEEAGDAARRLGRTTASAASHAGTSALDLVRTGLNILATLRR